MNADLLRELPLTQRLAVSYAPKGSRQVTIALLALDARLASVTRAGREPIAAQLRLAWWRERLGEAPAAWPVGEPVLGALRQWRDPAGLVALVDGWEGLVAERLDAEAVAQFAGARAQGWLAAAAELGCASSSAIEEAARLWACGDLAAHLSNAAEKAVVLDYATNLAPPSPLPWALRPLTVLAHLARAGLADGGRPLTATPRALLLALRTGLTGR